MLGDAMRRIRSRVIAGKRALVNAARQVLATKPAVVVVRDLVVAVTVRDAVRDAPE
jgi:hypothetical protein